MRSTSALRPGVADEVRQETLFEDDLAVVARADHPCLKQAQLGLRDLLQWPWVVPLAGTPANVRGLLFKEQEAGYLAGYLAGLYVASEGGTPVIR